MTLPHNPELGLVLLVTGVLLWTWGTHQKNMDEARALKQGRNAPVAGEAGRRTTPNEDEKARALALGNEVMLLHGHSDYFGIEEDILSGNSVVGPCSVCGVPRTQPSKREKPKKTNGHFA